MRGACLQCLLLVVSLTTTLAFQPVSSPIRPLLRSKGTADVPTRLHLNADDVLRGAEEIMSQAQTLESSPLASLSTETLAQAKALSPDLMGLFKIDPEMIPESDAERFRNWLQEEIVSPIADSISGVGEVERFVAHIVIQTAVLFGLFLPATNLGFAIRRQKKEIQYLGRLTPETEFAKKFHKFAMLGVWISLLPGALLGFANTLLLKGGIVAEPHIYFIIFAFINLTFGMACIPFFGKFPWVRGLHRFFGQCVVFCLFAAVLDGLGDFLYLLGIQVPIVASPRNI
uniref:Uncharacterized protein n=1 Tax=Chromera velia CCMP2878 TaxID=1169474 RepID=A0A0G4FVV3_9ALVE|eukprot:Cvel_483.t1-p1 / transcript=Cvel_483.t1 / gene=Cvel_483 / organism=Chromera_velia_CCMP2878 / gene_product=hypothetical protein / transcript_product=hypothetical protein / location=Cvel_scaffold15:85443-88469(-) / protein_length=285 / sequence_SO=supercontig / SO=protein_coding / is_pseudo=false